MGSDAPEFAVVDVETTGLFPGGHDRIIEIAVLRVRDDGVAREEFCSLINPCRDVGPTHIHGIRAADVAEAPTFDEVLGDVLALLEGAVFVAHNASFDARFLRAEAARAGCGLPDFPVLCTMRFAHEADPPLPSRRLADLCEHFHLDPGRAHSALDDARATAQLFAACVRHMGLDAGSILAGLDPSAARPDSCSWPSLPRSGRSLLRAEAARRRESASSYIAQLVEGLAPTHGLDADTVAYQELLDRVLEDRRVTPEEGAALADLAREAGLSQADATAAHENYVLELLRLALEDGVISEGEEADLQEVRRILGVGDSRYAALRAEAEAEPRAPEATRPSQNLEGTAVCFTGTMQCIVGGERAERHVAQALAKQAGMVVKSGVSKKLDMLVLADPDSMSGKARRARELGVRLVSERVFWQMLGVAVE